MSIAPDDGEALSEDEARKRLKKLLAELEVIGADEGGEMVKLAKSLASNLNLSVETEQAITNNNWKQALKYMLSNE